jgi:hypothetical protein
MMKPMTWLRTRVGWLLVIAGVLVVGVAGLMVFGQGMQWLQHGVWPPLPARYLFATDVTVEWVGAQKILDQFLAMPMTAVIAVVGMGTAYLGLKMVE